MTSQPIPSPHQLPAGFLYCADLECAYCRERRAERFRNPAQLFVVPKSNYVISSTRDLTMVDLISYTCYSIVALDLAVMGIIYLSVK